VLVRQARDLGLKQVLVGSTSIYSPKFIELGGTAANGVFCTSSFFPKEQRPEVQKFVASFRAKYGQDPDTFCAISYDTMVLFGALARQFGPTREGMREGLAKIQDVPSVIYGKLRFNPETRRVQAANYKYLIVANGAFSIWDGTKPTRPDM